LIILYNSNVILPDINTPLASRIQDNTKYTPYFDNCIGALDGTHIEMHIPASLQPRYRNRKGTLSQNVLAACDFDLKFTYILAGWDAQVDHGFHTPEGRYWLGDAGYGNSEFIMAPYRGVRYHLKEQRQADQRPQNAKELFNLRHSSKECY
jgi:hypothetical protein